MLCTLLPFGAKANAAPEKAEWKLAASTSIPARRHSHGLVFDEARGVALLFGGIAASSPNGDNAAFRNDVWEYDGAMSSWKERLSLGTRPELRVGAAVAWDSQRNRLVVFGGRSGGGSYYEDIWEWDPVTDAWLDRTAAGAKPRARAHASMVYDRMQKKMVIFGGGHGDSDDFQGPQIALGDTWEWDPVSGVFTEKKPASALATPSPRHSFALAFDSKRSRTVLFGGLSRPDPAADAVPKQDTWDYDGATGVWTERTAAGAKPSARYGHASAFDAGRNKFVLFSGFNISAGDARRDVWEWDGMTGSWIERLETPTTDLPPGKMGSRMTFDSKRGRVLLFAGFNQNEATPVAGKMYSMGFSRETWELDTTSGKWSDRELTAANPSERQQHALAFDPVSGTTLLFGGADASGYVGLDDTWEWDGKKWAVRMPAAKPSARMRTAMAYDPARKSIVLFGGRDVNGAQRDDMWEWTAGMWKQIPVSGGPSTRDGHAMATDSARNKVILYGGVVNQRPMPGIRGFFTPFRNDVWEWDGATGIWKDRSPPVGSLAPNPHPEASIGFDEARRKMVLLSVTPGDQPDIVWEWDVDSGGWSQRKTTGRGRQDSPIAVGVVDSIRRKSLLLNTGDGLAGAAPLWELDSVSALWTNRMTKPSPSARAATAMAFDSVRGVVVLVGGTSGADETWEFSVTNVADGVGCTSAQAARCGSGFCVDGVCCAAVTCSGGCRACNVPGMLGTCASTKPGTQVSGMCTGIQACDGIGACKVANGQACAANDACASGFCVDGLCCDTACSGACQACNGARPGVCSAYVAGTDPEKECDGMGTGNCAAVCDGVGACRFPNQNATCGSCGTCNQGTCREPLMCQPDGGFFPMRPIPRGPDAGFFAVDAPAAMTSSRDAGMSTVLIFDGAASTPPTFIGVDASPGSMNGGSLGMVAEKIDTGSPGGIVVAGGTAGAGAIDTGRPSEILSGSRDGGTAPSGNDSTLSSGRGCSCDTGRARGTGAGAVFLPILFVLGAIIRRRRLIADRSPPGPRGGRGDLADRTTLVS